MKTVLLIDNDDEYRQALSDELEAQGLEVVASDCPHAAYQELVGMGTPDIIVGDLHMPFTTGPDRDEYKISYEVGVRTLRELAWVFPETPVIALTALDELDIERARSLLAPIPAYRKTEDLYRAVELVKELALSRQLY
ncbi:MAG: response regulator [Pseudomonadota bacterium]|jgi:CheY-like chemotaxis protein